MDRVGKGYKLCMMGNMNGWIGKSVRDGITGAFEVPGENDNGRRGMEFCAEKWFAWVKHTLSTRVCINSQGWQGTKVEWR